MDSIFSIVVTQEGISVQIGKTTLRDIPSVHLADKFIIKMQSKRLDEDWILNDSGYLGFIGSLSVDQVIEELKLETA